MVGTTSGSHAARLAPGFQLGDYRLGAPLWSLRIADAYKADGAKGLATIYVIHARIAADPGVRDQIIAGTRAAAQLPEHKHLVRTLAAGLTGDILWIATEEVDGSLVRDLLLKKRQTTSSGLGTRATGNLVTGVCTALGDHVHGALADESIAVSRTGRVRVLDLALAAGTLAAIGAGLVPASSWIAPELADGSAPTSAADVYGVGGLLYEALVGQPLERGGPRPSDVVEGANLQIDEVVARACHRDPTKRFGRVDVLGEVVAEALTKGGAVMTSMVPLLDAAPSLDHEASQVTPLPQASSSGIVIPAGGSLASAIGSGAAELSPVASGNISLDRIMAAALADSTEKWLVTKGKLDYGPFSLAGVLEQIEKGDIVAGHLIMDKDTGARVAVDQHTLLGPMIETAREKRDHARRAQAEVKVQSRDKTRGVLLYTMITVGLLAAAAVVYLLVVRARADKAEKVTGVAALDGASLKVTVSMPKAAPPRPKHTGGTGSHRTPGQPGGNYTKGSEDLSLDMSDEGDDESSGMPLDMTLVYGVYSKQAGRLGGCLASAGARSANIYMNIDGPSGKVTFVKIDGKQSGSLYGCLNGVLRSMKFPSAGARTRAEFDIGV